MSKLIRYSKRLVSLIREIEKLHEMYLSSNEPTCSECGAPWPCNTIRVIHPEQK